MFTREEVAERAGVDVAYVDRLIDADIIHPDAAGRSSLADVRRTRFVKSLELAGVSLEGMATAVREGTLSFSYLDAGAFDESFATLSTTTFRELSERTGVSLELLSVVREAVGFAQPRPEDLVRDDELDVVPAIKLQLESGFRPAAIERYVRGADPRGRCATLLRTAERWPSDPLGARAAGVLIGGRLPSARLADVHLRAIGGSHLFDGSSTGGGTMEPTQREDPWDENDGEALESEILHADDSFEVDAHGTTAEEATEGLGLDAALARERPDRASVDEVVAIEADAAPDEEDELVADAALESDSYAPPEEAAVSIRGDAPGATDHPDPHDNAEG